MSADPNATNPVPVSSDELTMAFTGPAFLVNKMYLTMTPATGRIAFMEVPPGMQTPVFRTAVVMTVNDLLELRDLLNRMLEGKVQHLDLGAKPNA